MPISSAEISSQIGMFQQQSMQNMQYGGMISSYNAPQQMAEGITSGIMNRAYNYGAPVASFAQGMMGMDAMGAGMGAGMMASGMGMGALGSAAIGMGVGGAVGGMTMAAGYGMNQMFSGAQQQQQFNSMMRNNYGGMNFRGINNMSSMGQISSNIRGMAGQTDPSTGMSSSMSELTQLAGNMGKMGLMTGANDAREFTQKFKSMMDTVKVIAREMGTSLQQAQEVMTQLKGSGVFQKADQMKASMGIRAGTASGTIAQSEMMQAGNIGSQISRSIGGRGRAGFMGGLQTMNRIGQSLDSGLISEEDIYNSTGQTGAEGRQALATSQMGQSANFLRGRFGRVFLASMAGANGQINDEQAQAYMSGGMGTGQTVGAAHGNVGKIGAANYLRNEGKLRGAALEKFGGMIPAMALSQWAGSRGIDINTMNDREMIFAQRMLGMNQDDLEIAVKQAQNLPQLARQQRMTSMKDQEGNRQALKNRTTGLSGLKHSFEHAQHDLDNRLQQAGAEIYKDMSSSIETAINKMMGNYVQEASKDVLEAYEQSKQGGGKGSTYERVFGGGAKNLAAQQTKALGVKQGADVSVGFFGQGISEGRLSAYGMTDYKRMEKAGYGGLFQKGMSSEDIHHRLQQASDFSAGASSAENVSMSAGMREAMRNAYAGGMAGTRGADRDTAMMRFLEQQMESKDSGMFTEARDMYSKLRTSGAGKSGSLIAGMEEAAGIEKSARLSNMSDVPSLMMSGGTFATKEERNKALSSEMYTTRRKVSRRAGFTLEGGERVTTPGADDMFGPDELEVERKAENAGVLEQHTGEFLMSEAGQKLAMDMLSADPSRQDQAHKTIQDRLAAAQASEGKRDKDFWEMIGGSKKDTAESRDIEMNKRLLAGSMAAKAINAGKEPDWKEIQRVTGQSEASAKAALGGAKGARILAVRENDLAMGRMVGSKARDTLSSMGAIATDDKALSKALMNLSDSGREAAMGAISGLQEEAKMRGVDAKHDRGAREDADRARGMFGGVNNMSAKDLRADEKRLRDQGAGSIADMFGERASYMERAGMAQRKGAAGIAGMLGVQLTGREQIKLNRMSRTGQVDEIMKGLGADGPGAEQIDAQMAALQKEYQSKRDAGDNKGAMGLQKQFDELSKQKNLSSAASDVKSQLEHAMSLKGEDQKKALANVAQSGSARELAKEKQEKQSMSDPSYRALTEIKTALGKLEGIGATLTSIDTKTVAKKE